MKLVGLGALTMALVSIWFPVAAGTLMVLVWAHACVEMGRAS